MIHKKKYRLGTVSKKILEDFNRFDGANLTLSSGMKTQKMFGLHERSLIYKWIVS